MKKKRTRRQKPIVKEDPKKEETGGNVMSFKDKLSIHKPDIIRWAAIVGIVAVISALMVMFVGVEKAAYNVDMARQEQGMTTMGSDIADNTQDISQLRASQLTDEDLTNVMNATATNAVNITALGNRLISTEGNITAIWDGFADLNGSPPEAWLTGNLTAGNITVDTLASTNGTYTANVHLVFAAAAVNWTANWTAPNAKDYIAVENHDGNTIGCWWNVGTFDLVADTEKAINVLFGGLADTVSFAYVEIWPVLK